MPNLPWVVSGVITDIDGSSPLANAFVTLTNITTISYSQTATTAADGSYSININTGYSNGDILVIQIRKSISNDLEKRGVSSTTVDVGLPGKIVNITVDKVIDRKIEDVILRAPIQEREERIFSPAFNAIRVLPTGFETTQTTLTRDVNNFITEIDEDDGLHIKVSLLTRDANNFITNIAERIK
jgi:hypothetical protein